jgi:hypothetical protein
VKLFFMLSTLLTLLTGAACTLLATAFVQLRIVPQVETRKRREERWERDIRALGELLAFEFADQAGQMFTAIWLEVSISSRRDDLSASELAELREQQADRMHEARQAFARACDQVVWLMDQISAPGRRFPALADLDAAMSEFMMAQVAIHRVSGRQSQLFFEEAKQATSRMERSTRRMQETVRKLSWRKPPPLPGPTRRAARQVRQLMLAPVRLWTEAATRKEDAELEAWIEQELAQEETS